MGDDRVDVAVLGATGVTGRRVAQYLARCAGDMSWAAVARDVGRVHAALERLGVRAPRVVAADVADPGSLDALAASARVVLNLVGPYTRYAPPVVAACVAAGTHYVDLTGEMPFARRLVDEYDDAARSTGSAVVPVCGYESLPPDLALARLAAEAATLGRRLDTVDLEVEMLTVPGLRWPSDLVSGGTVQSLLLSAGDRGAELVVDPAALIADEEAASQVRRRSPITLGPRVEGHAVIAPMVPAPYINPAVLHRSALARARRENTPFTPFRYREGVVISGGPATVVPRWAAAAALAAPQVAFRSLTGLADPLRETLTRMLARNGPAGGSGPDVDRLDGWRWRQRVTATLDDGRRLRLDADGEGHPGYRTTASAMAEAGCALAERGPIHARGGVLSPSEALGVDDLGRYARAGLHFREVETLRGAAVRRSARGQTARCRARACSTA